jgi:hypothetical protein
MPMPRSMMWRLGLAKPARKYTKPTEYAAILNGKNLTVAADRCPEFKSLLNTLLQLGGLTPLE